MIAVGIDWARTKHQIVVLSAARKQLACFVVPHSGEGLAQIAEELGALEACPQQVRIGIEGHEGPLMDWLEDQGYTVLAVNPKTSKAARDLVSSSGSKDDRLDAYALAQFVLLGAPRVSPRERPQHDRIAVVTLLRQRERRVREKGDLERRLTQLLQEWAPALAALCANLDLVWTRALLARWPLEQDLRAARPCTLRKFAQGRAFHKSTLPKILETRKGPLFPIRAERLEGLRREIRYLLGRLEGVVAELKSLEAELTLLVEADPDHEVVATLPGTSTILKAAWLAAFASGVSAEPRWRSVASHAGVSPVTRASGSMWSARCRRSRDPMLQRLLTYHAFQTVQIEGSWAWQTCQAKRAQGKGHYTILRGVAQRWVKIVHAMLRDRTAYNEELHSERRNPSFRTAA
jgi:transposase